MSDIGKLKFDQLVNSPGPAFNDFEFILDLHLTKCSPFSPSLDIPAFIYLSYN